MFPPGVGWSGGVRVVSEPKGFDDPTPMETVEEMTLGEARRRYPDAKIAPVKVAVGFKGKRPDTAYPIEEGEALFYLDEGAGTRKRDRSDPEVSQRYDPETLEGSDLTSREEPSLDELRQIASGKMPVRSVGIDEESDEVDQCPYKELDTEANEWVYCRLPVHSPKVKHQPGKRESA
jgi:hypothetical protein